ELQVRGYRQGSPGVAVGEEDEQQLGGDAGCEVLAVSNWILHRDDQVGCLVFAPSTTWNATDTRWWRRGEACLAPVGIDRAPGGKARQLARTTSPDRECLAQFPGRADVSRVLRWS